MFIMPWTPKFNEATLPVMLPPSLSIVNDCHAYEELEGNGATCSSDWYEDMQCS